jgi:hypothetical protein
MHIECLANAMIPAVGITAQWQHICIPLITIHRRFNGSSHVELPCNEVPEPLASELRANLSTAAHQWWKSIVAEPHSFSKPTFYLGLGGYNVSNVLAAGAHQRTPVAINLLLNGAAGFRTPGDALCWDIQVVEPGAYEVTAMYTSEILADFQLAIGEYGAILNGSALSITRRWPVTVRDALGE